MIALILQHAMPVLAGAGVANALYRPKPKTLRRRKVSPQGAESPDAELIALCTEFGESSALFRRLCDEEDRCETPQLRQRIRDLVERRLALREKIASLTANSAEGLRGKAAVAVYETCDGDPEGGPMMGSNQVAWSLARDILARDAT